MSKTDFTTLTIERLREVLDYCPETGLFTWRIRASSRRPVGSAAGATHPRGNVAIQIDGKFYPAHRLAFFWVNGKPSTCQHVDHIDRNPSNNKFANLREASCSQNGQNANLSKANSSWYKGVCWNSQKGKWQASLTLHRKFISLGRFSNLDDAVAARKQGEIIHHSFRVIN